MNAPAHPLFFKAPQIHPSRSSFVCGGAEGSGETTHMLAKSWIYDAVTGAFTPLPALPAPRLAMAVVGGTAGILVLGGEDRPRGRTATVWRLVGPEATGGKP